MIKESSVWNFAKIRWLDEFMAGHNGFIAGGCFKNIFNNENVKDLDIFFENNADWEGACKYFDRQCGEDNKGCEYRFYYENGKVKAYKHQRTGIVLELCQSVFGKPSEVLDMFDFTITKFAYAKRKVKDEDDLLEVGSPERAVFDEKAFHIEYYVVHEELFFEHLHLKRLVVDNKLPYPVSTFERMLRYAKYGYFPCKETKLRIIHGIREVPTVEGLNKSLYNGLD